MPYIVASHFLDKQADVYRLAVAWSDPVEVPITDADGHAVVNDDGTAQTQEAHHLYDLEDFVFAADDERWQGKSAEDIAAAQVKIVTDILVERAKVEPPPEPVHLPGVGEPLKF